MHVILSSGQQVPYLNGWWTSVKKAAVAPVKAVAHVTAEGIRMVPGGSTVTNAANKAYAATVRVEERAEDAIGDAAGLLARKVRAAVKAAIRPIVKSFAGDSPFFMGADESADGVLANLKKAKVAIVAAATAAATSAGAAAGSVIPGAGTAAGGAMGAAITPAVVDEIIDEIVASAKATKATVAQSAAQATSATTSTATGSQASAGLPSWAIPVAIVGGAWLLLRKR